MRYPKTKSKNRIYSFKEETHFEIFKEWVGEHKPIFLFEVAMFGSAIFIIGMQLFTTHNFDTQRLEDTPIARITEMNQKVLIRSSNSITWSEASLNQELFDGDRINTQELSDVKIILKNGAKIVMGQNSILQIDAKLLDRIAEKVKTNEALAKVGGGTGPIKTGESSLSFSFTIPNYDDLKNTESSSKKIKSIQGMGSPFYRGSVRLGSTAKDGLIINSPKDNSTIVFTSEKDNEVLFSWENDIKKGKIRFYKNDDSIAEHKVFDKFYYYSFKEPGEYSWELVDDSGKVTGRHKFQIKPYLDFAKQKLPVDGVHEIVIEINDTSLEKKKI